MRRRWLAFGLAALLLLAIGTAIGRRATASQPRDARPAMTVTVTAETRTEPEPIAQAAGRGANYARTPRGAAAAATTYLSALSGPTILDAAAVRRTLSAIASVGSQDELTAAYQAAAVRAREQLGAESAADPSVVLRAAPVGYRVDGFQRDAATVSVWRVGIVGAGSVATRQSWRTETMALVWEDGTWKLDAVRSSPGPTPPLAGLTTEPGGLASTIATFEEFTRDVP
jgi:hypothetical protein